MSFSRVDGSLAHPQRIPLLAPLFADHDTEAPKGGPDPMRLL
jgi:hypothetical protein